MNYLLDKKTKRKNFFKLAFFFIILSFLIYFRSGIFNGFAYVGHKIFRPGLILGYNVGEKLGGVSSFFVSRNSLAGENEKLKSQLEEDKNTMTNYNSLLAENISLKDILGRIHENDKMILAAILGKSSQSPYDTLIIDVGTNQGILDGNTVFALGNVPIGRISAVYPNSSKVILFSNSGEKTKAVVSPVAAAVAGEAPPTAGQAVKDVFMEVTGRGGGNFELILPRDFTLVKGDQVVMPGITPYVLGIVETTISDPRDPFVKALLVSPVNIQELKFVEVKNTDNGFQN